MHVLFLHPHEKDAVLNRLTSYLGWLTHGVGACHVEISLPYGDGFLTSSIYNGEKVSTTTQKTFANPGYIVHTLMVSDKQLAEMKKTMNTISSRWVAFLKR